MRGPWLADRAGWLVRALRPYQVEARDAVHRSWESDRSTLLVMATGTGKTFTAGEILRERAPKGRILWLAHRSELLTQASTTLRDGIGLGCELEKAEHRATTSGELFGGTPVVVASVQTLRGNRLRRWPPRSFSTIVVDEAHHAAAQGYREILGYFADAKVLGLTATPDRGDGVGLSAVFDDVAYEYGIRTAIADGYLVPIVQKAVECADLDLSDVRTVAGDLAQGELEQRLKLDSVLHQIAGPLVKEAGNRPTIVFTAGVAMAKALVDVMAGYAPSDTIASIDGETPTELRVERLEAFQRGDLQYLLNCGVLTEGFDAPKTACIAMARPTKSRSLYAQCVGRGTRLSPGKVDCLVLDFRGNAGRHKLCSPIDVLAGKPLPDDVAARALELADGDMPSDEALAQAEAEAIARERAADERRRREAKIKAQVAYRAFSVDPFGYAPTGPDKGPRASDKQAAYLRELGVDLPGRPSRKHASKILDTIQRRRRDGLCTHKQGKLLAKHGLTVDIPFADAREVIDAIAGNGWRAPGWVVAKWGAHEAAE